MNISTLTARGIAPWVMTLLVPLFHTLACPAQDVKAPFWNVDDLRPGMKGVGKTVMKGTRIEDFQAEVIGVLKNTAPGRDLVLCRLSGADLERTGVIQGMSGSPIYIQGKMVGAVAYAWAFGKDPIAGVTPFSQMQEFALAYERRDQGQPLRPKAGAKVPAPAAFDLSAPVDVGGRRYDSVTVQHDFDPTPAAAGGLWMTPLRTPLAGTNMSPRSLALLNELMPRHGFLPVQGGGLGGAIPDADLNSTLAPGSAMCIPMIVGDFDMSSIGTVTHVEGKRVYGFGHPMMMMGECDFPLMTGYVHTIYPRVTLSFKMGSPMKQVGVINADVSTCVAGWLDRVPDMMPLRMVVRRELAAQPKEYNVRLVRNKTMIGQLVQVALTNALEGEGDPPDEMTAHLKLRLEVAGREPLIIQDAISIPGAFGPRATAGVFQQLGLLMMQMNFNPVGPLRADKMECQVEIKSGRRTADIEGVEMDSEVYAPGETVKATVLLRPYKAARIRMPVQLKLPADLPEGNYTAALSDDLTQTRQELRDNPELQNPTTLDQVYRGLQLITSLKRTNLVVRLPLPDRGVSLGGQSYPNLPGSMVQILGGGRRTGTQPITSALVERHSTDWIIFGGDSLRFQVAKNKRVTTGEP